LVPATPALLEQHLAAVFVIEPGARVRRLLFPACPFIDFNHGTRRFYRHSLHCRSAVSDAPR
jgi:hypothetical protein